MGDASTRSRPRLQTIGVNAALAVGSLLVALLLCELVARLVLPKPQIVKTETLPPPKPLQTEKLDTRAEKTIDSAVLFGGPRGVRLRPNTRADIRHHSLNGRDVVLQVDSLGLRYDELGPKREDEYRVLVLGDSITFGDFVPEEETWTRRMEADTAGRPKKIRFINAGLPGAGTIEELYLYEELQESVKPDLVLVGMYLNDAQNATMFYGKALPRPYSHSRFLVWAANRFQLLDTRFFKSKLPGAIDPKWREEFRAGRDLKSGEMFTTKDGFDFEIYNAYMDFGLGWNPKAWEFIGNILGALKERVRSHDQRLAVVLFPIHIQIMGTVQDFIPQERARSMCAALRVPFLDPLPDLRAAWAASHAPLLYDHCHYTPRGYDLLARRTVGWLDGEKLIPPPGASR